MITAAQRALNEEQESRLLHRCRGRARHGDELDPKLSMANQISSRSTEKSQNILTSRRKPNIHLYGQLSREFMKACEELNWNHERSTPQRSETHGIAERAVRRVKAGTSPVQVQSGRQESWWAEAMECYCFLRNVQDRQTPHERRFNSVSVNIISSITKQPRSSVSVRHKCPP